MPKNRKPVEVARTEDGYPILTAQFVGDAIDRSFGNWNRVQAALVAYVLEISVGRFAQLESDDPQVVDGRAEVERQTNLRGSFEVTDTGWEFELAVPIPTPETDPDIDTITVEFPRQMGIRMGLSAPAKYRQGQALDRWRIAQLTDTWGQPQIDRMPAGDYYMIHECIREYLVTDDLPGAV